MRERFLIGLVIGCLAGALCAPLLAQSWNRLYLTRAGFSDTVTSITSVKTTATVTTSTAHGLATGDSVVVAGATQAEYNGTYRIAVTSPTEFTYTFAGSATSPATGTITVTYPSGQVVPLSATSAGAMNVYF